VVARRNTTAREKVKALIEAKPQDIVRSKT
jgi:hypothetical protein